MAEAAAAATVALMFRLLSPSLVLDLAKETQAIGKLQKIVTMLLLLECSEIKIFKEAQVNLTLNRNVLRIRCISTLQEAY